MRVPRLLRSVVALVVVLAVVSLATEASAATDPDGGSDKPAVKPGRGQGRGYGWYRHDHHDPARHDPAGPGTAIGSPGAGPTDRTTLVNDPAADTDAHDTQSESTVIPAGPNVVVAYNDTGSYAASPRHFVGWATSPVGTSSFTDHGALPTDPTGEGDGGDPFLARDAATGRVYLSTIGG